LFLPLIFAGFLTFLPAAGADVLADGPCLKNEDNPGGDGRKKACVALELYSAALLFFSPAILPSLPPRYETGGRAT